LLLSIFLVAVFFHVVLPVVLDVFALLAFLLELFILIADLSEHDDFILCLGVFPAAENEQVWANCGRCVSESGSGWVTQIFSTLPAHGIGRPNHEVVAFLFSWLVLKASALSAGPSTEHHDVRARHIHRVAETVLGRRARNTKA